MYSHAETNELVSQAEHNWRQLSHPWTPVQGSDMGTAILHPRLHLGCIQRCNGPSALSAASHCEDTVIALSASPDLSQWFQLAEIDCQVSSKEKQSQKACIVLCCASILFAFFTSGLLLSTTQTTLETELRLRYRVNYPVKYHRKTSLIDV